MPCREAKQTRQTDTEKESDDETQKENDLYGRTGKKYWISFFYSQINGGKTVQIEQFFAVQKCDNI